MANHIFKLPSGPECEVKFMTGKHQRILTERKDKPIGESLNEILADVIVRVGDQTNIDIEFVREMLAADRKKALVESRQFTLDFPERFEFTFKYLDGEKKKCEKVIPVDISDGFPTEPYHLPTDGGKFVPANYTAYGEVQREFKITLPKSGEELAFKVLTGKGEMMGAATKKDDMSSHTSLKIRNPRFFRKAEKDTVPVVANLDNMHIKDIEYLRAYIKKVEGRVDTELRFEHPDADRLPAQEREVVVDLLGLVPFFFPSEAI